MNKQIKTLFYIKQPNGELLYVANSNGGPELNADVHAEIVAKVPQALKADIYAVSEGIHKLVWKAQIGTKKPAEEVGGDELQDTLKVELNEPVAGVDTHTAVMNQFEIKFDVVTADLRTRLNELEVRTTAVQTLVNDNQKKFKSEFHTVVHQISAQGDQIRLLRRTLAWLILSVFFFGLALMAKIIWG